MHTSKENCIWKEVGKFQMLFFENWNDILESRCGGVI